VCRNIDNESFLQALQIHVFDYGIPQRIVSDNGSPIVSSVNQIKIFLDDVHVKNFLKARNIETLTFSPYPAHASFLGGPVESLVKQVKNMIYSSISKNVLTLDHFCFIVKEVNMLINKRPISFKRSLSAVDVDPVVSVITPEMLVRGYDIPSVAIVPHLQIENLPADDYLWTVDNDTRSEELYKRFEKLKKVKSNLNNLYYDEFLQTLRESDLSRPNKYKSRNHDLVEVNDLVAVKEKFTKPYFFPVGIVSEVEHNDLDESVAVSLRKPNGEIIRRHVTDVILLEKNCGKLITPKVKSEEPPPFVERPLRAAAQICKNSIKKLTTSGLV
jgi:hypothetical protein